MLTGRPCRAAAARTRLSPGSAGSAETPRFIMMRMPTVPGVAAQSAIVSATAGSLGIDRLDQPEPAGMLACTSIA